MFYSIYFNPTSSNVFIFEAKSNRLASGWCGLHFDSFSWESSTFLKHISKRRRGQILSETSLRVFGTCVGPSHWALHRFWPMLTFRAGLWGCPLYHFHRRLRPLGWQCWRGGMVFNKVRWGWGEPHYRCLVMWAVWMFLGVLKLCLKW